jgi:hypothetical protein
MPIPVNKNNKLVESVSKYLNNPYLLDESAEHKTHHPESEHYSDDQHAQNLHKAFKDARRKMTSQEVSKHGSGSDHHARHQKHMGFHDPTIGNSDNHSQSKLMKTTSSAPSARPVEHTPKNHLEKTGTIKHASGHHAHVYHGIHPGKDESHTIKDMRHSGHHNVQQIARDHEMHKDMGIKPTHGAKELTKAHQLTHGKPHSEGHHYVHHYPKSGPKHGVVHFVHSKEKSYAGTNAQGTKMRPVNDKVHKGAAKHGDLSHREKMTMTHILNGKHNNSDNQHRDHAPDQKKHGLKHVAKELSKHIEHVHQHYHGSSRVHNSHVVSRSGGTYGGLVINKHKKANVLPGGHALSHKILNNHSKDKTPVNHPVSSHVFNKSHDPHKHEGGAQLSMDAHKKRPVQTPVSQARKEVDRKGVTVDRPGMPGHRTVSARGSGPDQPKHRKSMRGSGMYPEKGFHKKL